MITIIAGSRTITNPRILAAALGHASGQGLVITAVLSGAARGVDALGEAWARSAGLPITRHPAQWELYGKSAGIRRNEEMAQQAGALLALWDGQSRGTAHMILRARQLGLAVHVYRFEGGRLRRDHTMSQPPRHANAQTDSPDPDWWRPEQEYLDDVNVVDWDAMRDDGEPHGARKRRSPGEIEHDGADLMHVKLGHQDAARSAAADGAGSPPVLCTACGRPTGSFGQVRRNRKGQPYCIPCADQAVRLFYEAHPQLAPKPAPRTTLLRRRDGSMEELTDRYAARYHLQQATWMVADTKARRWLTRTFDSQQAAELHAAYKSMEWEAQRIGEGKQHDAWRQAGYLISQEQAEHETD